MKTIKRSIMGSLTFQTSRMQSDAGMKDRRTGDMVFRRTGHDSKWQEWRREKAMSWPKSFLRTGNSPGIQTIAGNQHTNAKDYKANDTMPDRPPLGKGFYLGRSIGKLLEDPMELSKFDELDGSVIRIKGYNMQDASDEFDKQITNVEDIIPEKSTGYRRAKGGLRDLIRLHEEEIARASGSQQVYAKRPKHDDSQHPLTPCLSEDEHKLSFEECMSEIMPTTEGDIKDLANENIFDQVEPIVSEELCESSVPDNAFIATSHVNIPTIVAKIDKATSTETIEPDLRETIVEKQDTISKLKQEKEDLLSKLEEQKKVANAYQKLEDRYRRKVYDLEKMMFACTCGALDSRSASEQDLTKNLTARCEPPRSSSHLELQQPRKVDNIINELERWMMDQKGLQVLHDNSSDIQDFMASESSLSSLSDVRLSNFPFEFIDQFDATSV